MFGILDQLDHTQVIQTACTYSHIDFTTIQHTVVESVNYKLTFYGHFKINIEPTFSLIRHCDLVLTAWTCCSTIWSVYGIMCLYSNANLLLHVKKTRTYRQSQKVHTAVPA